MSVPPPTPPEEEDPPQRGEEEDQQNDNEQSFDAPQQQPQPQPPPFLDFELLRRRISDLDARQKAGHELTDTVDGTITPKATVHESSEDPDVLQLLQDFENLKKVFVIVFTNARDSSEGIYSLNIAEENIVLAFQDKEEARRYAMCLEQQHFPAPKISELNTKELADFCGESGYRLGFVPKGSLITPPEQSAIDDLDKWRGDQPFSSGSTDVGMTQEEIDLMRKKLDSLFGQ